MTTAEVNKALDKAKIALMRNKNAVFFTTVCFSLNQEFTEAIPTAQTNGRRIQYNPQFFMSLAEAERVFLLLHETLHVALMHVTRLGDRDMKRWNVAGDYVINALLIANGFTMPKGGLYDPKYANMSTEEVYDLLESSEIPEDFIVDIQMPGAGDGSSEQTGQPQGQTQAAKALEKEIDAILVRAATQAQMSGKQAGMMPKEIEIYLNNLVSPKIPWKTVLRRHMRETIKENYSFLKPNRRFFPDHLLPTAHSEGIKTLAVAIDTSGSVSDDEFNHFISEVAGIFKVIRPKEIVVLQFDTCIKSETRVTSIRELKNIPFCGRGGTDVEPVIHWTAKHKPHLMLIFTDGYFSNQAPNPKVPVFWIIHSNDKFTSEYGKVVPYTFSE